MQQVIHCPTRYCTGYSMEPLVEEQPWGDLEINWGALNRVSRCTAVYRWTANNRDKARERTREWYKIHREQRVKKMRVYYHRHKDEKA